MNKKEQFVLGVMAKSISMDINNGRNISGQVVIGAFAIAEEVFNRPSDELGDMIEEYVQYQYQTSPPGPRIERPDWIRYEGNNEP